jgi:arsenate reductase
MKDKKLSILFLCTGNACRSQIAEGWARHLKGDLIEPCSAGIEARGLDPLAVKVMAEVGVDIGAQHSKHVDELPQKDFDYVITLCNHAHENCPHFPSRAKVFRKRFDDPHELARQASTEQEVMANYRRVRDEIKAFVEILPQMLATKQQ